jgi:hypothetical protein
MDGVRCMGKRIPVSEEADDAISGPECSTGSAAVGKFSSGLRLVSFTMQRLPLFNILGGASFNRIPHVLRKHHPSSSGVVDVDWTGAMASRCVWLENTVRLKLRVWLRILTWIL